MNLTLIIPTNNRPNKLKRLIDFIDHNKVKIIIIDSSDSPFAGVPSEYKYFYKPEFNFSEKITFACENSQSDYVALCADDDFFLINEAIKIIEKAPSNVAGIIGSPLIFNEHFDGNFYYQKKIKTTSIYNSSNANIFFQDYSQVLWGIYSRNALSKVFHDINLLKLQNDNFIEMYMAYFLIINGGSVV